MDRGKMVGCVGIDGGRKKIPSYLVDKMLEQGWHIESADVERYYDEKGIFYLPQLDQTLNKPDKIDYSILESRERNNVLEVEVI